MKKTCTVTVEQPIVGGNVQTRLEVAQVAEGFVYEEAVGMLIDGLKLALAEIVKEKQARNQGSAVKAEAAAIAKMQILRPH